MKLDGRQVAALRLQRAMSQEELAGATGLSARTIQRVENGAAQSLETRKALVAVLGTDLLVPASSADAVKATGYAPGASARAELSALRAVALAASSTIVLAELLFPQNIGVFTWPDGRYSVGIYSDAWLRGSTDILGPWLWVSALVLAVGLCASRLLEMRGDHAISDRLLRPGNLAELDHRPDRHRLGGGTRRIGR